MRAAELSRLAEELGTLGGAIAGLAGKAAEASEAASQATPRGGAYRVLVDANQHVDREAAARSGVGFYGKNTMLITRRCGSYWTQSGDAIPDSYRSELGVQVYGCDICQDVCPWNRGIEKRRAGLEPPAGAEPHISLVDWLEASDDELAERYDRLFVPRNDPRYLRRNALVALGNTGGDPSLARRYAESDDELLREHAEWALERLGAA